ncbi:MAG: lytic transglycosylase domain-containing protein [Patescibacteria group bacterium]|nr:lytic transglycosylase domain-containing protein [Patescibacteria group bacterium]
MPRSLTPVQRVAFNRATRLLATDPRYQKGVFLKPSYVMAHCQIESNWDPSVRSTDGLGSIGLMQVLPVVAQSVGVMGSQLDPAVSVETGMRVIAQNHAYLKHRLGRAPSLRQLVMAYNEGAGAVANGREDPHYWDAWMSAQQEWACVDDPPAAAAEPPGVALRSAPAPEDQEQQASTSSEVSHTDGAKVPSEATAPEDGAAEQLNAEEVASETAAPPAGASVPESRGISDQPVFSPGDPGFQGEQP